MSSAADSPVRISPRLALAPDWMVNVLGSGASSIGSFASYDPDTRSWKMSPPWCAAGYQGSAGTWPKSGTTRSGACWELMPLGRRSIVSASGWWLTPTRHDWKGQSGLGNRRRRGRNGRLHVANLCDQIVDTGRQDLVRSYTFREWLMGLPIGHTDLLPLRMPWSHKSRNSSVKPL